MDHRQVRDGEALEGNEEDATLEPLLEETDEGGGTDNTNLGNTVGREEHENEEDLFEPLLQEPNEGGDEAEAKKENTVEAESAARNSEKAGAKEKETDAENVDEIAKKSSERIGMCLFPIAKVILTLKSISTIHFSQTSTLTWESSSSSSPSPSSSSWPWRPSSTAAASAYRAVEKTPIPYTRDAAGFAAATMQDADVAASVDWWALQACTSQVVRSKMQE